MPFKLIRDVDDPASAADLIRVQQNVQAALLELAAPDAGNMPTALPPQYRASGAEDVIFVNQAGGRVTVVLPEKPVKPVTIRSISTSANAVSIMSPGAQPSGTAPTIDGASVLAIDPMEAVRLAFDGRAWWSV